VDKVLELLAQGTQGKFELPEIGQTIRVVKKDGTVIEVRRAPAEAAQGQKPSDIGGQHITDVAKVLEILKAARQGEVRLPGIGQKYRVVLRDGTILEFERGKPVGEGDKSGKSGDGESVKSEPKGSSKSNDPVAMTDKKQPNAGRQRGESPDPEIARQGRLQGEADARRAALERAAKNSNVKPTANSSGSDSGTTGQPSGGTDIPANEKSLIPGRGGKSSPDEELARQGREVGRLDAEAAKQERERANREAVVNAQREARALAQQQRDAELARRAQERAQAIEEQQRQEREREERNKGKGGRSR
jgi:hypothetical protein